MTIGKLVVGVFHNFEIPLLSLRRVKNEETIVSSYSSQTTILH